MWISAAVICDFKDLWIFQTTKMLLLLLVTLTSPLVVQVTFWKDKLLGVFIIRVCFVHYFNYKDLDISQILISRVWIRLLTTEKIDSRYYTIHKGDPGLYFYSRGRIRMYISGPGCCIWVRKPCFIVNRLLKKMSK